MIVAYVPQPNAAMEDILRGARLSYAHCQELDYAELSERAEQYTAQLAPFIKGRNFQSEVAPIYRSSFEYFREEERFLELLQKSYQETGNQRFQQKSKKYELYLLNARNLDIFIQKRAEELFLKKSRAKTQPGKLKLTIAALVICLASVTGCTDAQVSQWTALGEPATVDCYSGGKLIYHGKSTGKVASEKQSDGWLFKEAGSDAQIRVSGDCVIRN